MSNWFSSFSLPAPFKSGEDDHDDPSSPEPTSSPAAAVNHDLSPLSQTLSHHFRGVAAFLIPPPSPSSELGSDAADHPATAGAGKTATASSETIAGIKNDLVEIGTSFKSLLSSSNKAVAGISKFASNFLQFEDSLVADDDGYQEAEDVAGISEEVVDFVREVSLRPELWTDFPLSLPSV